MTGAEKFFDRGGIIWDRGVNFKKSINRGSDRGASHRGRDLFKLMYHDISDVG